MRQSAQPHRRRQAPSTRAAARAAYLPTQSRKPFPIWAIVAALAVIALLAFGIVHIIGSSDAGSSSASAAAARTETVDAHGIVHGTSIEGVNDLVYGRDLTTADGQAISFAAVGDVFATSMNFDILDAYAGEMGDGLYDFAPYYQAVEKTIKQYDLSFINQETPCAGNEDGFAYSGYPVFNTPDSSISALATAGFNIVNFNSNHSWDQWDYGIERTQRLFKQYPHIMLIGSYESQEDRDTVRIAERNGMKIAFLSYCFLDNMYGADPDNFPNTYYSCPFDPDTMRAEIERAQSVADAVVVYMHWGTEYETEPDDQQLEYAQFLVDLDVDLVIGSHAHILQPIRYYTSPTGKQIPVVFGLSDFITGWTLTDTIFSGMFTCDFVKKDGNVTVENCAFHPAIEWQSAEGGDTYVRFLEDMTDAEIAENLRTEDVEDDVGYLHAFLADLQMEVPVTW